jgi:hypothetical protein
LRAGIQTTLAPAAVRLAPEVDEDAPIKRPPLQGCAASFAAFGIGILVTAASVVTFVAVCTGTAIVMPLNPYVVGIGVALGLVAGFAVAWLILMLFYRRKPR